MNRYLLIWEINDYPDFGGGTFYKRFDNIADMEKKVNELNSGYGDKFKIGFAGEILNEVKFKPVEKITEWKAEL